MKGISITYVGRTTTKEKKNVSINFNIRVSGFPVKRVASGISVPAKNFKGGAIFGNGEKLTKYRKRLDMMSDKIEAAYYDFISQDRIPNPELILQYVSNKREDAMTVLKLAEIILQQKSADLAAKNCTYALVEKFKIIKSQLEQFINKELLKNDVFLEEVNFDFVNRFRTYLQSNFDNRNVTLNKKMSNVGQIFKYAVKNGWIQRDFTQDLKKLEEPRTNHEFLTENQVKDVINFELPQPEYEVVQDSFLFMCFTGMAFSDMAKFTIKDIGEVNGVQTITYARSKTEKVVHLPVTEFVNNLIIKNYLKKTKDIRTKELRPKTDSDPIFSVQANQVYNRRLKTFFEFNEMTLPFEISSHCGRKTFGNMVNRHLGLSSASQFLGHSSMSITETNYVNNNDTDLAISRGIQLNSLLTEAFKNS